MSYLRDESIGESEVTDAAHTNGDSSTRRAPEQPPTRSRRRRSSPRSSSKGSRNRLRAVYFAIASAWGFLIGTAAILGALSAIGRPLSPEPIVLGLLLGALILALIGGGVASAAYREATRRRS